MMGLGCVGSVCGICFGVWLVFMRCVCYLLACWGCLLNLGSCLSVVGLS